MRPTITLGSVLFNWPGERWRDFYFRIADEAQVDHVVIGETVCSKRAPFFEEHVPPVIERLERAGKTVVLSTLIMPTLERERRQIAEIARSSERLVEANDMAAVRQLKGRPHWIGPYVNVYNEAAQAYLARQGATRICLPPELPLSSVRAIAGNCPMVDVEVFAFGRLPLAISARCYHARVHGLAKDSCQFVCEQDADGLDVLTVDSEPFLAINGVQTMSHAYACLIQELPGLDSAGIKRFRLSPHSVDMVAVADLFRATLDRRCEPAAADAALRALAPNIRFANGFAHGAEGVRWLAREAYA